MLIAFFRFGLFVALLLPFVSIAQTQVQSLQASQSFNGIIQNKLMPFTSDGCSKFPDGYVFFEKDKWRNCCVTHDIAYWQGGTAEQKIAADRELRSCVSAQGASLIGKLMYPGVRIGGYVGLPTSWYWGYGWVLRRDYSPLNKEEILQVEHALQQVPSNLNDIVIVSPDTIPQRETLTGDYCVDAALAMTLKKLGRSFEVLASETTLIEKPSGHGDWTKTVSMLVDGCESPIQFSYYLTHPRACQPSKNELHARSKIRPYTYSIAKNCLAKSKG